MQYGSLTFSGPKSFPQISAEQSSQLDVTDRSLVDSGWIKYGSPKQAYMNIRLEKEAHANESDLDYLKTRRRWAWASM
jgi:hypothetical protein